ncbi:MAG: hydrogenase maturation protease [Candidatus Bipolaricaulia bacterium]
MSGEAQTSKSEILLIGIGNGYRGDDRVGLVVARKLRNKCLPNTTVVEATGEGAALMEAWKGADTVILVDAVSSSAGPGTIHRFDAHVHRIPANLFRYSTHAFSVVEAIELARALGQLPPRLIVYGVEGKSFEAGTELSTEVETAAGELVESVMQEVQSM